jgi:hypothetical protein
MDMDVKEVWVVTHWYDHGESRVDSVWTTELDAMARSLEIDPRIVPDTGANSAPVTRHVLDRVSSV